MEISLKFHGGRESEKTVSFSIRDEEQKFPNLQSIKKS